MAQNPRGQPLTKLANRTSKYIPPIAKPLHLQEYFEKKPNSIVQTLFLGVDTIPPKAAIGCMGDWGGCQLPFCQIELPQVRDKSVRVKEIEDVAALESAHCIESQKSLHECLVMPLMSTEGCPINQSAHECVGGGVKRYLLAACKFPGKFTFAGLWLPHPPRFHDHRSLEQLQGLVLFCLWPDEALRFFLEMLESFTQIPRFRGEGITVYSAVEKSVAAESNGVSNTVQDPFTSLALSGEHLVDTGFINPGV